MNIGKKCHLIYCHKYLKIYIRKVIINICKNFHLRPSLITRCISCTSLGIMGTRLRAPLKPLNTIDAVIYNGFQGGPQLVPPNA